MTAPLQASMPQFTQLGVNARIDVEALDPTTGAPVSGVTVTTVDIYADVLDAPASDGSSRLAAGPFMFISGPGA